MSSSPATRAQPGSVILTALDVPYVQDFNTLASSGTSSSLPAGWEFVEAGTNANTIYTAGTGSGNAGDTYSFGGAGSTERAFGGLQSGSLIPTIGAVFTNSTDQTITSIDISYTGEQWRLGATGRADRLDFQYSLDATSLSAGTWIDVDLLDFNSPVTTGSVGALTGASAAVSSAISGIAIPPGASFRIRWTDFNAAGADDGLSIDDFSVTPHTGGAPVVSVGDVSVAEGNSGTLNATFIVSVSSAAHTGITFNIATAADETGSSPATAGEDYAGRSETNQTIPAGTTTYAFDVAISGDLVVEDDETFQVLLTSVSGATLADGIGIGTIVNDDEPPPVDTDVVISQVYGGGGNAGATLTHDFVELFNPGSNPVNLTGWSVQYTSATGTGTWQVTPLSGFIEPGHYYLIQQAQGTGGTAPLPAPDATGTIAMAAGSGKVALQNTVTPIVGNAPAGGTADLVGYGAASFFEGSGPTAPASNTTAALRKRGGCFDSDNNNIDFAIGNPAPRNSLHPGTELHADTSGDTRDSGQRRVLSAVRTGRDHERCRDWRESERLLPADARCRGRRQSQLVAGNLRVHLCDTGRFGRQRPHRARHRERILRADSDRGVIAGRCQRHSLQRRPSVSDHVDIADSGSSRPTRSARAVRGDATDRPIPHIGRADR